MSPPCYCPNTTIGYLHSFKGTHTQQNYSLPPTSFSEFLTISVFKGEISGKAKQYPEGHWKGHRDWCGVKLPLDKKIGMKDAASPIYPSLHQDIRFLSGLFPNGDLVGGGAAVSEPHITGSGMAA